MLSFDYKNLFKLPLEHGVSLNELDFKKEEIDDLLLKIKNRKQGFADVLDNDAAVDEILEFVEDVKGRYEFVVILGIGGSALGTTTLQKSLVNLYKQKPKVFVLDNIDPDFLMEIEEELNLKKTLFLVVSKSGGTVETFAEYLYFREKIESANLDVKNHFVFVTDPELGPLRKIANEEDIKTFSVPQNVGGRFSVLTPVSLLPAAFLGIDIQQLIEGGKQARNDFYSNNPSENIAYQLAKIQYLLYNKGKVMNVILPYSSKLSMITAWYAQLLAESIGKDGIGITPVQAKGVTDQHSQNQIFHDGPNDKLLLFMEIKNFKNTLSIPENENIAYLKNATFNELLSVELHSTIDSLTIQNKPTVRLEIQELNATTLGALFFMLQANIAFLGELFNVNAYDQPGVELSKKLTKQYYEQKL